MLSFFTKIEKYRFLNIEYFCSIIYDNTISCIMYFVPKNNIYSYNKGASTQKHPQAEYKYS